MSVRTPLTTPYVTIVIKYDRATVVHEKPKGARLTFQAAGLDIFVKGSSGVLHDDCIPNIAMNECLLRHIPLISLRRVK